jgi:hypothetical protein
MKRARLVLILALWLSAGALSLADDATPAPRALPSIPTDVLNNPFVKSILDALGGVLQTTNGNTAAGRVSFFNRFELQLQTGSSVYRNVHLHQGTVINPRGTTLAKGMLVIVNGQPQQDGSLNADTITVH